VSWVVRQLEGLGYSSWAHRVVSSAGEAMRSAAQNNSMCTWQRRSSLRCALHALPM
jgi:hypothetical protein